MELTLRERWLERLLSPFIPVALTQDWANMLVMIS
jgi:hypothetical protein